MRSYNFWSVAIQTLQYTMIGFLSFDSALVIIMLHTIKITQAPIIIFPIIIFRPL